MGDVIPFDPGLPKQESVEPSAASDRPTGSPEPGADAPGTEPAVTREQSRSRRKRAVRAKTVSVKRMTKRELELGRMLYPDVDDQEGRPAVRGDCANLPRPCPFVSCKHHLYLDVSARTGAIKLNFPDLEVWEMTETCALDVAADGYANDYPGIQDRSTPQTLEETGRLANLTRERVRQMEAKAFQRMRGAPESASLAEYLPEGPQRYHLPIAPSDGSEESEGGLLGSPRDFITAPGRHLGDAAQSLLAYLERHDCAHVKELSVSCAFTTMAQTRAAVASARARGRIEPCGPEKSGFYRRAGTSAEPTEDQIDRWREGRPLPKATVTAPTALAAVDMEEPMADKQDRALAFLASKCQAFSTEEVQLAIGSSSKNAAEQILGKMVKLGLCVRPKPGYFVAKENANAIGTILDERPVSPPVRPKSPAPAPPPSSAAPAPRVSPRSALVQLPKATTLPIVVQLRELAAQRREQAARIDAFIADLWPDAEVA